MRNYTTRPDPNERRYQENRDRLAELQAKRQRGEHVSDATLREAEKQIGLDERNHAAYKAHKARLQAEQDARQAQRDAQHEAQAQQQIAAFKAQARAAFVGTAADFEQQWPTILAEWQRKQVLDALAQHDTLARKRDMVGF